MQNSREKSDYSLENNISTNETIISDTNTDSLSIYFKEMSKIPTLTAEEQHALLCKYNSKVEKIWSELTFFSFVASEYINILDELTSEKITENFFVLNIILNDKKRPESLILLFTQWRNEIIELYKKTSENYKNKAIEEKLKKNLHSVLMRYRPQNFLIYEWLDVANNYKNELTLNKNPVLREKILDRIKLSEADFFKTMKRIEIFKSELEEIRKRILEANLRLVISTAKYFQNRGASLNDLVQDGNIGLIKALDKFDCRLGHKFSTYAVWWIKHLISKGLAEHCRTIRIPAHMIATINKLKTEEQFFIQKNGRTPEPEELAKILDMPKERIRALQRMAEQPISLQAPIGENNESTLSDLLEDESSDNPINQAAFSILKEKIKQALDMLSEKERLVISMRFGLDGYDNKTLEEISGYFNLSKERIRQIEMRALEKLRHPSRRKLLEGYF
ncbi:MAG TPA: sigma-70 family RNA polymerase sigma factor [Victivallales bacterium]|nr:sigma-70 family RNA polymerase sigma factor [Victivallales bacterium]HPO91695.1 sigma-70 family RNA polymerase sigma factor [Victivallales bacterium]HRU01325.1 sigma-70 family RNA polymerase sigma factor [Victivallales bacterium]